MSRRVRLAGRFAAGLPSAARKAAAIRAGVQYLTAAALAAVPVASCTTVLPAWPTTPAPAWAAPAWAPTAITVPATAATTQLLSVIPISIRNAIRHVR